MKRMIGLLLTLSILYLAIQTSYNYFCGEHDIKYTIKTNEQDIHVHEIYYLNNYKKKTYFFEIEYQGITIPFDVSSNAFLNHKIVSKVNMFLSNNYTCAQILNKNNEPFTDIKCFNKSDNISYYYSNIRGQDEQLDNSINDNYNIQSYQSNDDNKTTIDDKITLYKNNLKDDKQLLLEDYKGVIIIGNELDNNHLSINLFNQDKYDKTIKGIVNKYYVVADYNQNHEFDSLYAVDINNGRKYTIKSKYSISFNSYVEGIVDNSMYIIDRDNKKQYEINLNQKKVKLISTSDGDTKYYSEDKIETKNILEVINNNITFDNQNNELNNEKYDKVISYGVGDNKRYYAFKKDKTNYKVFEISENYKTYLVTTTDINRFYVLNQTIYYLDEDNLMIFNPTYGIRKIITNKELKYNTKLGFGAY